MNQYPYIYQRGSKYVVFKYNETFKKANYIGTFADLESARAAQVGSPVQQPKAARRADCFDHLAGFFSEAEHSA